MLRDSYAVSHASLWRSPISACAARTTTVGARTRLDAEEGENPW